MINIPKPRPFAQSDDLMFEACDTEIGHFFVSFSPWQTSHEALSKQESNRGEKNLYCLSRARRISENAFGVLAARFWVFHTVLRLKPDSAT